MAALAVSIFEDGPDSLHLQALYNNKQDAQAALARLNLSDATEHFITQLPDEDWVAKSQAGLPPVEAGRFWIHGAHDADKIPTHIPWPVKIEAGAAFGTGHHGTTKGCLLIFDDLLKQNYRPNKILDLGCGAGTLAIAAAKALSINILATDIDADAVSVTLQNANINKVGTYINALTANGFDSDALKDQQFDLIFANILAKPLMGLAPDISKAMMAEGRVILSGILAEQAEDVTQAFESLGLVIKPYPTLEGWTSLLGIKPA